MLASKDHSPSKDGTQVPARSDPAKLKACSRRSNPLWYQIATRLENTAEKGTRAIPPIMQPKLTVGAPDDPYEQEADRVADVVMQMPEPAVQPSPS